MKIGIITQVLLNNYGGTLQNYALQRVLRNMGHEPITLDYIPTKSIFRVILSLLLTPFLFFTNKKRSINDCLPCKRDNKFEYFIKHNISVTQRLDYYSPSLINDYNLDAIIVGSDQVWRPVYNEDVLYDTFLSFTLPYKIKRIAYAASFGVSTWEFTEEQQAKCAELIKNFDAVSVREESGAYLCKEFLGVDAKVVLDPTLLLKKEDYFPLLKENLYCDDFIFSYILNPTGYKFNIITLKEKELALPSKTVSLERKNLFSIEEWLTFFYKSKLVITDSFHGTVFSIIFHKDFIVFDNNKRGSARLQSLLRKVGLENRLLDENNACLDMDEINWDVVDEKLNAFRGDSIKYLISCLS